MVFDVLVVNGNWEFVEMWKSLFGSTEKRVV